MNTTYQPIFESSKKRYLELFPVFQKQVEERMATDDWKSFNEILFSRHSCAIEGNSYSVNDSRALYELGLGAVPSGKTLAESMEMLDHFHGFFEHLHPFRDGNGRIGRLISNYILLRCGHPLLIIPVEKKEEYIQCLKLFRKESQEYLVDFFYRTAINRMESSIAEKKKASKSMFFLF